MTTRPDKYPEWATDPSSAIAEPNDQKKKDGWTVEKPPHQTFNWFWNLVYKWISFLDSILSGHQHTGDDGTHQLHISDIQASDRENTLSARGRFKVYKGSEYRNNIETSYYNQQGQPNGEAPHHYFTQVKLDPYHNIITSHIKDRKHFRSSIATDAIAFSPRKNDREDLPNVSRSYPFEYTPAYAQLNSRNLTKSIVHFKLRAEFEEYKLQKIRFVDEKWPVGYMTGFINEHEPREWDHAYNFRYLYSSGWDLPSSMVDLFIETYLKNTNINQSGLHIADIKFPKIEGGMMYGFTACSTPRFCCHATTEKISIYTNIPGGRNVTFDFTISAIFI